jgi:hypothetical protein
MPAEPFKLDPQLTSAFRAIDGKVGKHAALPGAQGKAPGQASRGARPKVVVVGGGTGASLSIRVLLSLDVEVAAVVSMADDGGSTGIIRSSRLTVCIRAIQMQMQKSLIRDAM